MKQEYENYTTDDLKVWKTLFDRQLANLQDKASAEYLLALNRMNPCLNANEMPNFDKINHWFSAETEWKIACVPGLIPVAEFFMLLADKKFPSSTWLRSMEKLDYLEEPDMFHDIFGHIPLLSNPVYSNFIHQFGQLGKQFIDNEEKLLALQRLYWFSIEFGLVAENNDNKIYGAGIMSSFGESNNCLVSLEIERLSFDIEAIINTHFCTSEMQTQYFVVKDFDQLAQSIIDLIKKWK